MENVSSATGVYQRALAPIKLILFRMLQAWGRQEWIRFGIRDLVIRLFVSHGRGCCYAFEVDYFGLKYRGNLKNLIDWDVYFYGAWEKDGLRLTKDLLNKSINPVCLDIGANCGAYSLFMSKFCKKIYAFEPNKKVVDALLKNIEINGIKNIDVHAIALGDKNCTLDLAICKDCDNGLSSLVREHADALHGEIVKVEVAKGDEIVEKLKVEKLDFIKVDVEGFEKNVLVGLEKTIKKYRPIIFLEFRKSVFPDSDEWDAIFQGYSIFNFQDHVRFLLFFNTLSYRLTQFDYSSAENFQYVVCLPQQQGNICCVTHKF